MRKTAALGAAGTMVTGALLAGAISATPASAGEQHQRGSAEARGVATAAARAAKEGIDWQDCPADWGLESAHPVRLCHRPARLRQAERHAPSRSPSTASAAPAARRSDRAPSSTTPAAPAAPGMRFPTRITTKNPLWAKTAKAYDFVGFDPRGVGHSAPISCMDPQEFVKAPKADPVPDSEADKRAQRKLAKEYADGCAERSGGMLPHMTTPNTARDLDVIRAALGEKKLNYLGVSYGTYLGAVYGTLFPDHVRRMIVDSVVNPSREKIWYQANLDQDVAFERPLGATGRSGSPRTTPPTTSATTPREGPGAVGEAAGDRQEEPHRRRRRPGRADRLLPERPVLRLDRGPRSPRSGARTSPATARRWSTTPARTCRTPRATSPRRTATPSTRPSSAPTPSGPPAGRSGTATTPGSTRGTRS